MNNSLSISNLKYQQNNLKAMYAPKIPVIIFIKKAIKLKFYVNIRWKYQSGLKAKMPYKSYINPKVASNAPNKIRFFIQALSLASLHFINPTMQKNEIII